MRSTIRELRKGTIRVHYSYADPRLKTLQGFIDMNQSNEPNLYALRAAVLTKWEKIGYSADIESIEILYTES